MIKVISGIRGCGKSFFFKSIIQELLKNGINEKDINKETEEREYRPFYMIKELYPRYLFTMDMLLQKKKWYKLCKYC